jgi:LEA14-like dessication related protein
VRLAWIHSVTFAISLPVGMACTPLGVWVYEDPGVRVSRIRLGTDSLSLAPVLIALDVQNPNDYPVSTVHVQLWLELDDERIGELNRDSAVELPSDSTSTVALPLVVAADLPAGRLTSLRAGTHRFAVMGRADFSTPIGKRKVRFAQEGDLRFGSASAPAPAPGPTGSGG